MTRADLRALERAVLDEIRRLPADLIEVDLSANPLFSVERAPSRAWKSACYTVQLYNFEAMPRLSVQRARANRYIQPKNRDLRTLSWDELMDVKRAVGFGQQWAVEIFPADDHVVDVAPMRHLWLLDEAPSFAWVRGCA